MSQKNYTLITGATSGIGRAFVDALAAQGRNLILVARNAGQLQAVKKEVGTAQIEIHAVPADLARDGVAHLRGYLEEHELSVDCLINNAGVGSGGDFAGLPIAREMEIVATNVAAALELAHFCLAQMRRRRSGLIINVASNAGFQPVPFMATYAASKAFMLHFSLALWAENRDQGVHVMALCPGPSKTGYFNYAGVKPRTAKLALPADVVAAALQGARARRPFVICGWQNRLTVFAERFVPRSMLVKAVGRAFRR